MPRKYPESVLVLNLHRKWFDMIASGEKLEEYREITPYWLNRLFCIQQHITDWLSLEEICEAIVDDPTYYDIGFNKDLWPFNYTQVHFSNGYAKVRPEMRCEIHPKLQISIGYGREEWGAEPGKLYFIIHLNGVVSVQNV